MPKGKLKRSITRITGTTSGEAKGVIQKAVRQVRKGNEKAATATLRKALTGGPSAGRTAAQAPKAKAERRATKAVARISAKQAKKQPRRKYS